MKKNMKEIRSLVITGFGINCEEETAAAYRISGIDAAIVHLNEIFHERCSIQEYDILNFPGGFSFGDDIGAAKVLANKLKYKKMSSGRSFMDELNRFLGDGKFIFGACNGFQLLAKLGLLPDTQGKMEQEITITHNSSGKFEDRWIKCAVNKTSKTPFLTGIELINLPVRHGEGKVIIKNEAIKAEILKYSLNCLSYADSEGNPTAEYPMNPNGSELNCAGLTNKSGQILGLMPHPEAHLSLYNNPDWGKIKRLNPQQGEEGEGLQIFKNIVHHLQLK